jgi:hypothetical protein
MVPLIFYVGESCFLLLLHYLVFQLCAIAEHDFYYVSSRFYVLHIYLLGKLRGCLAGLDRFYCYS